MISLLQAENISKRYGDKLLFENININISQGQKISLVAKNGTGKTSLLNIITGVDSSETGSISTKRDLKITYLPQEVLLNPEKSVIKAVFFQEDPIINAVRDYNNAINSENNENINSAIDKMDMLNAWDYEAKVKQILGKLEITDFNKKIKYLSGGQKKRVALAGTLISNPQLLILDEPTNHLDLNMIEWLEEYLSKSDITLFMVTHDRYFIDNVCNQILELDDGKIYSYNGNYSYFIQKRAERIDNLKANISKSRNLLRTEQEWIRRMPKARTSKSKFRIDGFEELKEKANRKIDETKLELDIASSRLGKKVVDIYNLTKSFDGNTIIKDFSYKIAKGEKIGIVGKNGCGKSTFLNLISGKLKPDSGKIEIGKTVKIAYYTQDGIKFDDNTKPIEVIKNIAETVKLQNGKTFSASGFLQYFLFNPKMQHNYIRKLSGGEKRRLYLCTVLMQQPNLLFMDEPTNDLDIMTLQVLEEYLIATDATVIIVSHDRFFMDEIVEHIFVFDEKGNIKDFPGNYTQYRESKLYKEMHQQNNSETKQKTVKQKQNKKPNNPNKNKRLSFNQDFELKQLEKEIPALEIKRKDIEKQLNSGTLNNDELVEKSTLLAQILSEIETKELRWLELTEIKSQ